LLCFLQHGTDKTYGDQNVVWKAREYCNFYNSIWLLRTKTVVSITWLNFKSKKFFLFLEIDLWYQILTSFFWLPFILERADFLLSSCLRRTSSMAAKRSTITATILPKRAMNHVSVRKSPPVRPGVRLGSCPVGCLQ